MFDSIPGPCDNCYLSPGAECKTNLTLVSYHLHMHWWAAGTCWCPRCSSGWCRPWSSRISPAASPAPSGGHTSWWPASAGPPPPPGIKTRMKLSILSFYLDKFQNFLKKKYIIIANILPSPKDWFLSWWLVFITDLDLVLLFPLIRWNDVRALRFLLLIPCCQFGALRFRSWSGSLCRMTPMLGPLFDWFLLRLRLLRRFHTQNWFPAH